MSEQTTVLVLESSQTFAMYLTMMLRRMGLQPLVVATVAAARTVLDRGGIDVVLVGDPGDDCPLNHAVQTLAQGPSGSGLPLVVVALHDDEVERQACLRAGCQAFLVRPVQPRQLHQALYANLAFAGAGRQNLRSSVGIDVDVQVEGEERRALRLLSLSRGGALIAHSHAVPAGTRVFLALPLADAVLPMTGSVIYNRRDIDERTPFAFAVLFQRESLAYGERIDSFLEALLQKECGADSGSAPA